MIKSSGLQMVGISRRDSIHELIGLNHIVGKNTRIMPGDLKYLEAALLLECLVRDFGWKLLSVAKKSVAG